MVAPLLFAWSALCLAGTALGLAVPVSFYTGVACEAPSNRTASASFDLDVCVVTPGMVSLHHDAVTCAGGGAVKAYFYEDTSCGTQMSSLDAYRTGSGLRCVSAYHQSSIAAFMFACNEDDLRHNVESATATTTVDVGPVATGTVAAPSAGASAGSSSNSSGQSSSSGWSSLSSSARIGIIVGASVFGVSVISIWITYRVRRRQPSNVDYVGYYPGSTRETTETKYYQTTVTRY